MLGKVCSPFVKGLWFFRVEGENPLATMFFYLNKYYLLLELHGAILFEVEIHTVLKRETRKFEESWQLASLKLLVVLV